MKIKIIVISILILASDITISHGYANSTSQKPDDSQKLKVGLFVDPPYVIKDNDGSFYGLTIDLWTYLADELDLSFSYVEYSDQLGLTRALDYKEIDFAVNPLPLNSVRLKLFDATQPFMTSGLGIAVSQTRVSKFQVLLSNIFSANFLRLIFLLIVMIIVFGTIMWFIEKRNNPQQFEGVIDGFWWSVVTMTTVGYGDKAPKTITGRVISVAWMFIAIILISSFTATIASTMTVSTLEARLDNFTDVKTMGRIGTVQFSGSSDYLENEDIPVTLKYTNARNGLEALSSGDIDVFIYDKSVLDYMVEEFDMSTVKILSITAERKYRSFLAPKESKLLDKINPLLVDRIDATAWEKNLETYHLTDNN